MKYSKQIIEAINRGVQLALDDFEDDNQLSSKQNVIKNVDGKKLWLIHNYVDLGLPSGTLWARYNLGGNEHNMIGKYYAWGETQPKKVYNWKTYKFFNDNGDVFKYTAEDGMKQLELEDDVVNYTLGEDQTMPTQDQAKELIKNTICTYVSNTKNVPGCDGSSGWILKSTINDNYIFFPNAGMYRENRKIFDLNPVTGVWLSTPSCGGSNSSWEKCAWALTFNEEKHFPERVFGSYKYTGLPVRPVLNRN